MDRGGLEPAIEGFVEVFFAMYETATGASEREGWPDHQRETDLLRKFLSFQVGVGRLRRRDGDAEFDHPLPELLAVFSLVTRLDVDANQSDIVFFPDTQVFRLFCQIQGRLSAHRRQYGVYLVLFQ